MWRKCLRLKVQSGAFRLSAVAAIKASTKPKPMREVQPPKVPDGLQCFDVAGPNNREWRGEAVNAKSLLRVLGGLIKFHQCMPRQCQHSLWGRSTLGESGGKLTMDIDHDIGIEQAYSL